MNGKWWVGALALIVGVVLMGAAPAADLNVKLVVRESAGVARVGEPVSAGVPLPRGAVKDPGEVRLVDAAGKEVPAQCSVINRWGADQSVMWLLVQSVATVPANGDAVFHLRSGTPTVKRDLLKVTETADAVTVDTGKIKFNVSKERFNLLDGAWLDANGDGRYAADERIVASHPGGGSVLTLKNGEVYASSAAPPSEFVVEERGPERATIYVKGLHKPEKGKGTVPHLYGYLARIRAYAGQPYLRVSYALTNSALPAIGAPVCNGAMIRVPLKLKGLLDLPAGRGNWTADVSGRWSASLGVRYLKENAPATFRWKGEGTLNWVTFLPWGSAPEYLDVCSHKTYEMQLTFAPGRGAATNAEAHFKKFDKSLRFWCEPAWVSQTRAWGDFGYVGVPDEATAKDVKRRFRPFRTTGWRLFGSTPSMQSGSASAPGGGYEPLITDSRFYLGYLQTGDRRFFDQLERTSWFWRDRRLIHLEKDISTETWAGMGGVYTRYAQKGYRDVPAVQPADYVRRFLTKSTPWHYGGRWGPMDTQHFSVDEVVNYYYLTGDRQSLLAINKLGEEAASFVNAFIKTAGTAKVGRQHGWVTRALVSVYEATGEERWLDLARRAVHAICAAQDKTAGTTYDVHERQTPFMAAAVGMALGRYERHHPEEDVRDAILGIADWLCYDVARPAGGFSYHWSPDNPGKRSPSGNRCLSTMSWAYLATGRPQYLAAADMHAGTKLGRWYLSGFGQEYITIKTGKRADAMMPTPVTDLKAEALGGGAVKLTWTAPGDDGRQGRAAEYQVKYATMEIKEHADWRTEAETAISFWAATNCTGEPKPAPAGARQTFTVTGLPPGTHWFALKTYDEQPNQSDLSNVVKVVVN